MKSYAEFQRRYIGDQQPEIERVWPWIRARTQQNNNVLQDKTLTWLACLPKDVRPMVLGRRFPRIANNIADIWRRVARCEEYLDTLVMDRRGNRTGFPPDVAQELNTLRGWYAELHPVNRSGWDRVGAET